MIFGFTITLAVKILLISWLVSRFEPLSMVLEYLPNRLFFNLVHLLLTCMKCISFWITICYTQNIEFAALLAFISFWWDKFIGPIENKVKL